LNYIIIIVIVCANDSTKRTAEMQARIDQVKKEHLIAEATRVTRARSRQPPSHQQKTHLSFLKIILLHIVYSRVGDWWSVWVRVRIPCTFYIIIMPTNIRVIRSTRSKSTCCYKYTRDNDHRSVVNVVTRAVYYV